jgi:hypothetical protein
MGLRMGLPDRMDMGIETRKGRRNGVTILYSKGTDKSGVFLVLLHCKVFPQTGDWGDRDRDRDRWVTKAQHSSGVFPWSR